MNKLFLLFISFLLSISTIFAQVLLDVAGDAKIHGSIELIKATGDSSLFLGANSGINDDGGNNLNTFVGINAGKLNTSGRINTFIGSSAGAANTNGDNNVFLGYLTGAENTTGDGNLFLGNAAGNFNKSGGSNVFLGRVAGKENTTGGNNVFVGDAAGFHSPTGNKNVFLGGQTGPLVDGDSLHKAIAIGYGAEVNCHNCAVIGGTGNDTVKVGIGTATPEKILDVHGEMIIRNSNRVATFQSSDKNSFIRLATNGGTQGTSVGYFNDGTDKYFFINPPSGTTTDFVIRNGGNVGIGILDPNCKLDVLGDVCASGAFISSDKRFKKSIKKIEKPLEKLARIEGVTYQMRTEKFEGRNFSKGKKLGLIAQNVEKTFPELVKTFKDGYKAVNYDGLIPVLVEGINQQQALIQEQQIQIDELKSLVEQLVQNKSIAPKNPIYHLELTKQASLSQNLPNPFGDYTLVEYFIPESVQQASLQVTTFNGKVLGSIHLQEKGKGSIRIKATHFPAGTYFYSLILDGKVQETKQMVLAR